MQPGEGGKIPIKLGTKRKSGPITKTITIFTNMPEPRSRITVTMKGEVWMPVQVTPRNAAFGKITIEKASQGMERKLTIVNNVEGQLKPAEIKSSNPMFAAELKPLEDGKKYEMTVRLVQPIKQGNNTGEITMNTGLEGTPELKIQTYAYITAAVDVSPPKLEIPQNRSRDLTRLFHIRSNTNKPIKVSNLEASNPELKLELTSIKNTLNHRLKVMIPKSYDPPPDGDRITFNTDNPLVPSITIPITKSRYQRAAGAASNLGGIGRRPPTRPSAKPVAKKVNTRVGSVPVKGPAGTGAAGQSNKAGKNVTARPTADADRTRKANASKQSGSSGN